MNPIRESAASATRRPSIILHIGLPKTGTTFLQTQVFPHINSVRFLKRPYTYAGRGFRRRVALRAWFAEPATIWRERGELIFATLLGSGREGFRADRPLLISDEGIAKAGRNPVSLEAHLREFRGKAAEWGFGEVKVICTIRRQDQWLGSIFVQRSNRSSGASQEAFEEYVRTHRDPGGKKFRGGHYETGLLLDYKTLRDHLVRAVGDGNVLMLPYELMGADPAAYLATVLGFIGEGAADLREKLAKPVKKNVRSLAPDTWAARKPVRSMRLHRSALLARLGIPGRLSLALPGARGDASVRMTETLKAEVLDTYSPRNAALADDLGIDLQRFGYC